MLKERTLEEKYIATSGDGISCEFVQWYSPLAGGKLPAFTRFN